MTGGLTNEARKRILLEGIQRQMGNCRRCDLCDVRQHIVYGGGNPDAPIMLVAGTVTWQEDASGVILKGDHGGLVASAMAEVGLDISQDVYATVAVKCQRPRTIKDGEKGRVDVTDEQRIACSRYLRAQLSAVNPVIVVAHGRLASEVLFGESRPFGAYAGSWRTLGPKRIALATHNPAGLTFGERQAMQPEYYEAWRGLAERLNLLGRLWKPDAGCFQRGWQPPPTVPGVVQ